MSRKRHVRKHLSAKNKKEISNITYICLQVGCYNQRDQDHYDQSSHGDTSAILFERLTVAMKEKHERKLKKEKESLARLRDDNTRCVVRNLKGFSEDPIKNSLEHGEDRQKSQVKTKSNSSQKTSIDATDVPNLKEQALKLYMENPYHTPKSLCESMNLDHAVHGATMRTYLWEFKRQFKNGSLQISHNFPVRHRRVFECLEKVVLSEERETVALCHDWKLSSNRNRMLLFKGLNGSVVWYRNGHVLIYLQGKAPLARALELFWAAFEFLGDKECDRVSKLVIPRSRHNVFCFGVPLPRMDIRYYEPSYGLRLVVDGSHPDSLEVIESQPLLLQPILKTVYGLVENQKVFSENLRSHADYAKNMNEVAHTWKKEAETRTAVYENMREKYETRIRRLEALLETRRQQNVTNAQHKFQRLCNWLNKDVALSLRKKGAA